MSRKSENYRFHLDMNFFILKINFLICFPFFVIIILGVTLVEYKTPEISKEKVSGAKSKYLIIKDYKVNGGRFVEGILLQPFCKGNTSVLVQMDNGYTGLVAPGHIFEVGIKPVKNDIVIAYHKDRVTRKQLDYATMGMC